MFNYSKRNLIIISFISSIVILVFINYILKNFNENQKKKENFNLIQKTNQIISNTNVNKDEEKNKECEKEQIVKNQYNKNNWRILIPKINLDAPILEGTNKENLRRGVGHFKQTDKWDGNVCLAAHNRGYKYNFFQEIKRLEIGDTIEYHNKKRIRTYSVTWKGKIKETDLSYLRYTNDNKLTLITCAENMPEYRLCIQAYEIKI
ncbi:MAG: class D sortase [Clostridiaceae bacterium]|nr:class D sortase [Clostridiaceae bacterium]